MDQSPCGWRWREERQKGRSSGEAPGSKGVREIQYSWQEVVGDGSSTNKENSKKKKSQVGGRYVVRTHKRGGGKKAARVC